MENALAKAGGLKVHEIYDLKGWFGRKGRESGYKSSPPHPKAG